MDEGLDRIDFCPCVELAGRCCAVRNPVSRRNPSKRQEYVSWRGSGEFHNALLGFMEVEGVIKEKVWVGFHVQDVKIVDGFQFLDVFLLRGALESHGEEQDVVVYWWLREGAEDVQGSLLGFMEFRAVMYRWYM